MTATVRIPTILRTYTAGVGEVPAEGGTLAAVLDRIARGSATEGVVDGAEFYSIVGSRIRDWETAR